MILKNKLVGASKNDTQRNLFREIEMMFTSTLQQMVNIYNDNSNNNKYSRYITVSEQFESLYNVLNCRFRNVFFDSGSSNTSVNLYNKAYNKRNYITVVMSAHPEYKVTAVNKYYMKFEYSFSTLWDLYRENLTLLYAKHGNQTHYLQIIISYIKVILDNFNLHQVNWNDVVSVYQQIINEFDDDEIRQDVVSYGEKPVRQRKSGLVYNSKNKNLVFEIKRLMDTGMKKKDICTQLGIGRTSLYEMIKNNPYLQ